MMIRERLACIVSLYTQGHHKQVLATLCCCNEATVASGLKQSVDCSSEATAYDALGSNGDDAPKAAHAAKRYKYSSDSLKIDQLNVILASVLPSHVLCKTSP